MMTQAAVYGSTGCWKAAVGDGLENAALPVYVPLETRQAVSFARLGDFCLTAEGWKPKFTSEIHKPQTGR
jgi:hypothetical protein